MKKLFIILAMLAAINASGQWQSDVRFTNDPAESNTSLNNAKFIASNGPVVHAVWRDNCDGNFEIYYKRSTDAGVSWGANTRLTYDTSLSDFPCIAVSGSIVHVIWHDKRNGNVEIYYKRSTDAGISWSADTRLHNHPGILYTPSVAVSGSLVHVVWFDQRNNINEIYYKRSTDAGISWGPDTRLTYDSISFYPSIAALGTAVYVIWYKNTMSGMKIFFRRSTDSGTNWEPAALLTNNTSVSTPSIAVSGSNVHVAWHDTRDGNAEIYYKRSTNGGINWGTDVRLTYNSNFSGDPSIAVSNSAVHIVWNDDRDVVSKPKIYYKCSTNSGLTWGDDVSLTSTYPSSLTPSIAISGTVVHVLWHDYRDANAEIYYKRNPTGNIGIQNISTETPSKYSLSQNYPNPFNSMCNVQFTMRNAGNAELVVYDVQGREVQTLVNESLKPGTYEVKFDGSQLTSGVYFYKLITDGFTETRKMLLIK